jgi:hypothetical protein
MFLSKAEIDELDLDIARIHAGEWSSLRCERSNERFHWHRPPLSSLTPIAAAAFADQTWRSTFEGAR